MGSRRSSSTSTTTACSSTGCRPTSTRAAATEALTSLAGRFDRASSGSTFDDATPGAHRTSSTGSRTAAYQERLGYRRGPGDGRQPGRSGRATGRRPGTRCGRRTRAGTSSAEYAASVAGRARPPTSSTRWRPTGRRRACRPSSRSTAGSSSTGSPEQVTLDNAEIVAEIENRTDGGADVFDAAEQEVVGMLRGRFTVPRWYDTQSDDTCSYGRHSGHSCKIIGEGGRRGSCRSRSLGWTRGGRRGGQRWQSRPVPQVPLGHVRRGHRPGPRHRAAAAGAEGAADQPRLPVQRPARLRQDLQRAHPRPQPELRAGADARPVRRLRLVPRARARTAPARSTSSRSTPRATAASTTPATCASAPSSRRSATATRCTSSTRRTW